MNTQIRVTVTPADRDAPSELVPLPGRVTDYRASGDVRYLHVFDLLGVAVLAQTATPAADDGSVRRLVNLGALRPIVTLSRPGDSHEEPFTTARGERMRLTLRVSKGDEP